ncbi:orotidine 5-phosphate decarboxylase pyrG-penicillium chrysogenum [Nemania sp. NC0429]|nr:orotidine 5-phosphate decarboxylase pyrG-penicillium chrysogenum [Nemania sp. NC0429]
MTSKSNLTYAQRGELNAHPLVKRLFSIAETKQSNLVISADFTDTDGLLKCARELGPHIAVLKTHMDLISDFSEYTVRSLKEISEEHGFLIFEDRKLIDIGNTVQKQYHGGLLRISDWAHIVNLSVLGGDGIVEALTQTIEDPGFAHPNERGFLILAEMTSKGSLATGSYTDQCVEMARKSPRTIIGFVATQALGEITPDDASLDEDFAVFTTGINMASKEDKLGQQYQTPAAAVKRGADFVIAGRGIYGAANPVEAAKAYQKDGWDAYRERTKSI